MMGKNKEFSIIWKEEKKKKHTPKKRQEETPTHPTPMPRDHPDTLIYK